MKQFIFMVPVYAGITGYMEAIRETWGKGRAVIFITGSGCEHIQGEDVLHLDCNDTYLGLIQKMGYGYIAFMDSGVFGGAVSENANPELLQILERFYERGILQRGVPAYRLCKIDPDCYVYPEYEARVAMIDKDLHGFGSSHSSIVGCCVAYSPRALAGLVAVHRGKYPELTPIRLSYLLTRLGTRDRLYPSEDTFATIVIRSLYGKRRIYADEAICTGHHTQVHTVKVKAFMTAFMELSPDGLRRVHAELNTPHRLTVLNNALRAALICERCNFRKQLKNGGQAGVLGAGGCILMDEPLNHFEPGNCPKGKHA